MIDTREQIMKKYRNVMTVWQNQNILHQNREPARANLIPYGDEIQAIETQRGGSPYFKLLNGDWKFNYFNNPAEVPCSSNSCCSRPGLKRRAFLRLPASDLCQCCRGASASSPRWAPQPCTTLSLHCSVERRIFRS